MLWLDLIEGRSKGAFAAALRLGLVILSLPYRITVLLRNAAYDAGIFRAKRLPIAVVSVGNIVAGGAGKSPFVMFLAKELRIRGMRPAVLSRGYGAMRAGHAYPLLVSNGSRVLLSAREAGDEPVMLAARLRGTPVVADPDRLRGGRKAAALGADIVILDDGFQHRRLTRDVNILLLDGARPFGNGRILPAGELREPPGGVARADIIVFTRCLSPPPEEVTSWIARRNPRAPFFTVSHKPVSLEEIGTGGMLDVAWLRGKKVAAFSGIARPGDFEDTLRGCGATVVRRRAFPDHHPYSAAEVAELAAEARRAGAEAAVTTAKDAVRIPAVSDLPLRLLCLDVEIEVYGGGGKLIESVINLLKGGRA